MKIINCEQRSSAWLAHRRCKVTGTRLDSVMGSRLDQVRLFCELAAEEATEANKQVRSTPEMERGTAEEPFAVKEFEKRTGKKVDEVGFCVSDEFPWLACSPDGFISEKGRKTTKGEKVYTEALEIKCPESSTAIFNRMANMIPAEELGIPKSKQTFIGVPIDYKWQMVNYFLVNEKLEKLYFAIYDARFISDEEKMYIVEVERSNPLLVEAMEQARTALVKFREDWMRWKEVVLPSNF